MRTLIVLLVSLLTACGAAPELAPEKFGEAQGDALEVAPQSERLPALTVCLYDVAPASRAEVVAGIEAWGVALAPWRDVVVADGEDCNVMIYEVGKHANLCSSDDAAGCTRQIGGLEASDPRTEFFLYRDNYETIARGAAMHEFGHLLGLTHVADGLMKAHMSHDDAPLAPDAATLAHLSAKLGVAL